MFDTLLIRPVVSPKNILQLTSMEILKRYGISIETTRIDAQKKVSQHAKLLDIWQYVVDEMNISKDLVQEFCDIELNVEASLLCCRNVVKELYDTALEKGKKIIIISDIHYSSKDIRELLYKSGYDSFEKIYVSNEYMKTKANGDLFEFVIKNEDVNPEEIVHIGDNFKSDYTMAQQKGIHAYYIPKNIDIFRELYEGDEIINLIKNNVYESIIYGYAINELFDERIVYGDSLSLEEYVVLLMFPILIHTTFFILNKQEIQNNLKYSCINFISRDGYLFMKAYNRLKPYFYESKLEAKYMYVSRMACRCLSENDVLSELNAEYIPKKCSLKKYIESSILNPNVKDNILNCLTVDELTLNVVEDKEKCRAILNKHYEELQIAFLEKKEAAEGYYRSIVGDNRFVLIMDCGFSGTIAKYLFDGFGGEVKFDKIFLWETPKNHLLDEINKTATYKVFEEKRGKGMAPLMEMSFSDTNGSCIGFRINNKNESIPILDNYDICDTMYRDIEFIQEKAMNMIEHFALLFEKYIPDITPTSFSVAMNIAEKFFADERYGAWKTFENIKFREVYSTKEQEIKLSSIIYNRIINK